MHLSLSSRFGPKVSGPVFNLLDRICHKLELTMTLGTCKVAEPKSLEPVTAASFVDGGNLNMVKHEELENLQEQKSDRQTGANAVREAESGKADLVSRQKAYFDYLKAGGRSGISMDFGRLTLVSDGSGQDSQPTRPGDSNQRVADAGDGNGNGQSSGSSDKVDPTLKQEEEMEKKAISEVRQGQWAQAQKDLAEARKKWNEYCTEHPASSEEDQKARMAKSADLNKLHFAITNQASGNYDFHPYRPPTTDQVTPPTATDMAAFKQFEKIADDRVGDANSLAMTAHNPADWKAAHAGYENAAELYKKAWARVPAWDEQELQRREHIKKELDAVYSTTGRNMAPPTSESIDWSTPPAK